MLVISLVTIHKGNENENAKDLGPNFYRNSQNCHILRKLALFCLLIVLFLFW